MNLLTIDQVAERLAVTQQVVRKMLPALGAVDLHCGQGRKRLIRIPEDRLDAYINQCGIPEDAPGKRARKTNTTEIDLDLYEPDGRIKRRRPAK